MGQDENVGPNLQGCAGPGVDERGTVVKLERRLGADGPARGQSKVADDDVSASLGHRFRLALIEDIRRGQEILLVRGRDHIDLKAVGHARLLEVYPKSPVDEPDCWKIL